MGSIWSIQFHQNECHNHFGPNSKVFSQAMTRSRMKGAKCIKDSFESQSVQLSATGLTCHRQSIISSFKIASEKLNHLSLSWCTFLITLPRLRLAFYINEPCLAFYSAQQPPLWLSKHRRLWVTNYYNIYAKMVVVMQESSPRQRAKQRYPCLVLFCSLLVHPHSVGPEQLTHDGGGGASLGGESP